MSDPPINPTRIIPAGSPLPPTARPMPQAPHGTANLPPWRTAAPPPAPPPPDPVPIPVIVTVHFPVPEPAEEPRWDWQGLWTRARGWIRPRQSLIAVVLAAVPVAPHGYSLITAWAAALNDCRTEASVRAAYVLAGGAFALALLADKYRPAWWTRTLVVITLIGGTGALSWFDPITALTGVHRS